MESNLHVRKLPAYWFNINKITVSAHHYHCDDSDSSARWHNLCGFIREYSRRTYKAPSRQTFGSFVTPESFDGHFKEGMSVMDELLAYVHS